MTPADSFATTEKPFRIAVMSEFRLQWAEAGEPGDLAEPARLFYPADSPTDRRERLARLAQLLGTGVRLLVCRRETQVIGALLLNLAAGGVGMVWPPAVAAGSIRQDVEDALLQHGLAWLQEQGVIVFQALVSPEEESQAKSLLRHGFQCVSRLLFLRRDAALPLEEDERLNSRLEFVPYQQVDSQLMAETLLRTYEGSADCPELNGCRSAAQALEGHRGQGVFHAETWWLVQLESRPIGVLLMHEEPEWEGWEISYMGLVPEARGRGLGCQLVRKALAETRARRGHWLCLTVDERNRFAKAIYEDLGFVCWNQRLVYLRLADSGGS
jgi:GNAT superfamily N-acetyltransferase